MDEVVAPRAIIVQVMLSDYSLDHAWKSYQSSRAP